MIANGKGLSNKGKAVIISGICFIGLILFLLVRFFFSGEEDIFDPDKKDISILQEYRLVITANQRRPLIADVATSLYHCTNLAELEAMFEVYDFSNSVKKQLTADFAGGIEVPLIETIEADEIGYSIDFETGNIEYCVTIRMYENGQNLGRYTLFLTVNKDLEIIYFRGY